MSAATPAGKAPKPPAGAGQAFLRGAKEPNFLSLAIAVVLGVTPLVALPLVVDEEFMTTPQAYLFATGDADTTIHNTSVLARAMQEPADAQPGVYLFGPSTIRNAVDVPFLDENLRKTAGADVRVFGFGSGLQRAIESLAMFELVPESASGVVVLSVGPHSLAAADAQMDKYFERPRLAMRLPLLEAEAAKAGVEAPPRSSNYFWDNRLYFVPRVPLLLEHLLGETPGYEAMPNRGKPLPTPQFLRRSLGASLKRWREAGALESQSTEVLERFAAEVARRPHMRLVLLEDTLNPAHADLPEFVDVVTRARATLTAFAERAGVPYLRLQDAAALTRDDFADAVHLRTVDGSHRYTHQLSLALARLLRGE